MPTVPRRCPLTARASRPRCPRRAPRRARRGSRRHGRRAAAPRRSRPRRRRWREHDVVAWLDRHRHAGVLPPVHALPDGEHDPVLRRRLVRARRDHEPGLAHALGLELLDDDPVEQRAQDVLHTAASLRPAPARPQGAALVRPMHLSMFDLDAAFRYLVEAGGSDLHLKVPSKPLIRLDGELVAIPDTQELDGDTRWAASRRCSTTRPSSRSSTTSARSTSPTRSAASPASASTPSTSAARCRWSSAPSRSTSCTIEDLNLPPVIRDLADEERGIVLLTGTTGSGKSTTLAAMIDHINSTKSRHIVTIEDPIEFLHPDKRSADQPARGRLRHGVVQARDAPRPAPGPGRDPDRRAS